MYVKYVDVEVIFTGTAGTFTTGIYLSQTPLPVVSCSPSSLFANHFQIHFPVLFPPSKATLSVLVEIKSLVRPQKTAEH